MEGVAGKPPLSLARKNSLPKVCGYGKNGYICCVTESKQSNMKDTRQALLTAIEHAPQAGKIAENLRGWWTPAGWYVCANCSSRIVGRGCQLPKGSTPVWADRAEPFGVCATCETPRINARGEAFVGTEGQHA